MIEKRLGRQTPTDSVILPYEDSRGAEAYLMYDQSGRQSMEWQRLMITDIMAVDADGLWVHMKFGWSVPRRNGKSELLIMRSIWGLLHEEKVLYTAHLVSTSHNAFEKICYILAKMGFVENDDYRSLKQRGAERIEWIAGEGCLNFRTRTATGGLGEGYDLLIIDEAQEYTADQETTLKYVVTDSKNPQTLMCGTPPTAVSKGTVFKKYREDVLSGKESDCGWAEWGVREMSDTSNKDLWYETNPSLGTILTERTIRSELGKNTIDDNIQRLGLWVTYNQHSAISQTEWLTCALKTRPALPKEPKLFMGVKYSKDSGQVSLAVAVRLETGNVFVEAIDCRAARDGNSWLIPYLRNPHVKKVVIDGASGQQLLVDDLKNANVKCRQVLPKVSEVIAANALFEQQLFSGAIKHMAQPALTQAVSHCEHRSIGSGGGFGYRSILEGADISLLEAVSLAHWACATEKEKKVQRIFY